MNNAATAFETTVDHAFQLELDQPGFHAEDRVLPNVEEVENLWHRHDVDGAIDLARGCAEAATLPQVNRLFLELADALADLA